MKILKLLTSWKLALVTGLLICILAATGSVKTDWGVYHSALFTALWVFFFVNLLIYIATLLKKVRKNLYYMALLILHFGILLILFAASANRLAGFQGLVYLLEGMEQASYINPNDTDAPLGFTIRCDDFDIEYYDGTDKVKSYKSDISILEDSKVLVSSEIVVSKPFTYKGVTFYQHSYGFYPNADGYLRYSAEINGEKSRHEVKFYEDAILENVTIRIIDFTPALAQLQDIFYTYTNEAMLNPAALFEINTPEKRFTVWIPARDPGAGNISENIKIHFNDFWGVEYTVLAVSKQPFNIITYIGFVFIAAGLILIYLPRMRKL